MFRHVLLALMSNGLPRHGYALMKALEARSGVRVSIGNVYRELQRLRADALIAAVDNPAGADPRRVPYTITQQGRAVLTDWLATPAQSFVRDSADRLYFRLALLAEVGVDHSTRFLDDLQGELAVQARSTERERALVKNGSPMLPFLLARRARHLAADIQMLDEIRRALTAAPTGDALKPTREPARRSARVPKRAVVSARHR